MNETKNLRARLILLIASLALCFLSQALFHPGRKSQPAVRHSTRRRLGEGYSSSGTTVTIVGQASPGRDIVVSTDLHLPDTHLADEENHEPIRKGACTQVSYGDLIWFEDDPKDLPLNELLIYLDHPAFVSPPNPDGPVIVDIGLHIHGVSELDPGDNSFFMEGYLDLVWCDSRTKFRHDPTNRQNQHFYLERDAAKELEKIWWPAVTFANQVTNRRIENEELVISEDGTVEYREKFGVRLSSIFDMDKFPFDEQVLVAEVESFAWNSSVVQFHVEEDLAAFADGFYVPEYNLNAVEESVQIRQEARDRFPFSEVVLELHMTRIPIYYVTKIIIPLILIVFISWAVFWMECDAMADRMAISFTGVLTSVAYQFIVADSLPRHIYNTFLDNFVLLSFVIMILTVLVNIMVHSMWLRGFHKSARIIDRVCQILFPLMFLTGFLILVGAQVINSHLPAGGALGLAFGIVFGVMGLIGSLLWNVRITERNDGDKDKLSVKKEDDKMEQIVFQNVDTYDDGERSFRSCNANEC